MTAMGMPDWFGWICVGVLICLSGLFSGLTLGLLGLDKIGLDIVAHGDDKDLARAARKIIPIRANGNRLLCTLLLGNVAVNTMLAQLLADLCEPVTAFVLSVTVIVILGEIMPQAFCSR